MLGYGGMHITGGSANFNALNAGSEITTWTAVIGAGSHGNGSVSPSISTGRLTLAPGVYRVDLNLTLEGNHSSGFSGDFAGKVMGYLARGGTLLAGTKSIIQTITEGLPMQMVINAIVEITQASQDAATPTNYVSAYLAGQDASGNDVTITEGRLIATRLS